MRKETPEQQNIKAKSEKNLLGNKKSQHRISDYAQSVYLSSVMVPSFREVRPTNLVFQFAKRNENSKAVK